jgi:hypothetical protein
MKDRTKSNSDTGHPRWSLSRLSIECTFYLLAAKDSTKFACSTRMIVEILSRLCHQPLHHGRGNVAGLLSHLRGERDYWTPQYHSVLQRRMCLREEANQ